MESSGTATAISMTTTTTTTSTAAEDDTNAVMEKNTINNGATTKSVSSRPPTLPVLPVCCILDLPRRLFRVTRSRGKTLASGGFGITITEPVVVIPLVKTTATSAAAAKTVSDDDDDDEDLDPSDSTPTIKNTKNTSTSASYLFIEEVLYLHERGMIECYRYTDDENDNSNDSPSTGTGLGDCTMMDATETETETDTAADTDTDSAMDTATATKTKHRHRRQQHRLDSYQLYNLLEPFGLSLPIYLVYAYLLQQDFRVLRHFPSQRGILDAMEVARLEFAQCQILSSTTVSVSTAVPVATSFASASAQQQPKNDDNDDDEDKDDSGDSNNNKDDTTNKKQRQKDMPRLRSLRLQLRREAAQAPPPVLCNTNLHNNNDDDNDNNDSTDDHSAQIAFDVYRPNSNFSKGAPGLPDFYVAATHFNNPTRAASASGATNHDDNNDTAMTVDTGMDPLAVATTPTGNGTSSALSFWQIQRLLTASAGRPLKIATISDAGTVIMFGITDHGVPSM
jgi:hypothetical protein